MPVVVKPLRRDMAAGGPSLRRAMLAACAAGSIAAGCGSGGDVAACRARQPTLIEGAYGCVTSSADVGTPSAAPLAGFAVEAFPFQPPPTPGDGLSPLARAATDDVGFYQMGLAAGGYWICTSFRRCVAIAVPLAGAVPLDYDVGAGPGWSPR